MLYMYILESYIKFEGKIFHGVYGTKKQAKAAKRWLKAENYDTQKYVISRIPVNAVLNAEME